MAAFREGCGEASAYCYEEGELVPEPTIRKLRMVRRGGTRAVGRDIDHYRLDAILAVGYQVRSERGTQFPLVEEKWCILD